MSARSWRTQSREALPAFTRRRALGWVTRVACGAALILPSPANASEGVVRDFHSGAPIPNAIVRVQATDNHVFSDAEGRFRLDKPVDETARIVAGAKGYYYEGLEQAGQTSFDFALEQVPYDPEAPLNLLSSTECAGCHATQHRAWSESRMGRTAQNRWVYDLYNGTGTEGGASGFVYTRDAKNADTNPAADCASCHTPERWAEEPGIALPDWQTSHDERLEGVSCLACHNVREIDMTKTHLPGFHPDSVTLQRGALVRFGSLGDVDYHAPGRMRASYQPQLAAELCSACHQDRSDPHNDGRYDGVASEPTFEEWRSSPYGDPESEEYQSCVGCHTAAVDEPSGSMIGPPLTRPLGDLRSHDFHGTTKKYLERALSLSVETQVAGDELYVRVRVKNTGAGHHVPTGIALRHIIVRVDVRHGDTPLEPISGPRLDPLAGVGEPSEGYLAGLPGKLYGRADMDEEGNYPVFFTEAAGTKFDERIAALEEDTLEFLYAYPSPDEEVHVDARAIYRRAWRELIDEKGWTKDGFGGVLPDIHAPDFGVVMAEVHAQHVPSSKRSGCSVAGADGQVGADRWGLLAALCFVLGNLRRRPSSLRPSA